MPPHLPPAPTPTLASRWILPSEIIVSKGLLVVTDSACHVPPVYLLAQADDKLLHVRVLLTVQGKGHQTTMHSRKTTEEQKQGDVRIQKSITKNTCEHTNKQTNNNNNNKITTPKQLTNNAWSKLARSLFCLKVRVFSQKEDLIQHLGLRVWGF